MSSFKKSKNSEIQVTYIGASRGGMPSQGKEFNIDVSIDLERGWVATNVRGSSASSLVLVEFNRVGRKGAECLRTRFDLAKNWPIDPNFPMKHYATRSLDVCVFTNKVTDAVEKVKSTIG